MEDMSSLWIYQESIDELKQKLLYNTLELESARAQANAEKIKNQEYTMQLLQLVKKVCKERDEAKDQLQKLLNKIMPSNSTELLFNPYPQLLPDSPLIKPAKAISSVTECNSFSTSSPASSFFDAVTSPDLSNLNQPFGQDYHDEYSLVIKKMTEGKPLPEKGKLLQAVLEAGPLLQTLIIAGPLPQWRNPPPDQPFEIPPFCINKGSYMSFLPKLLDSSFDGLNYGPSQMKSTISMVNFGSGGYESYLGTTGSLIAAETNITRNNGLSVKRQRSQ